MKFGLDVYYLSLMMSRRSLGGYSFKVVFHFVTVRVLITFIGMFDLLPMLKVL